MAKRENKRSSFGNIRERVLSDGRKNFHARYKYLGGWRNGPRPFSSNDDARNWLNEVEEAIQKRQWNPIQADQTFKEVAERWRVLPSKSGKPRGDATLSDYESVLKLHVYPFLENVAIGTFDVGTIFAFKDFLEDHFEEKGVCRTWQKAEKYTRYVLNFAVRKGALRFNPYEDEEVFIPQVNCRRDPVPLEDDDIEVLYEAFHPHYAAAIIVSAYLGLRSGEVWALRRSRVDLDKNRVMVDASVRETSGKGLVMKTPKNGKSRLLIAPDVVIDHLRAHMSRVDGGAGDWVFPNMKGKQVRHSTFMTRFFKPAVKKKDSIANRLIFHDLRHYCARWHISKGYDSFRITEIMGHSSPSVTQTLYGGLFTSEAERMAKMVDGEIRTARAARAERLARAVEVTDLSSSDFEELEAE